MINNPTRHCTVLLAEEYSNDPTHDGSPTDQNTHKCVTKHGLYRRQERNDFRKVVPERP